MNFYHGISAANGRPYSPPIMLRAIKRKTASNTVKHVIIHQGYCGQCGQWVDLQGKQPLLVPELKVRKLRQCVYLNSTSLICAI
ncbi:hypothetical protein BGW37DRAFT_505820 [Umbelopsis sp. PMI_123]|nr:hypothetical protein BGW37DRAFT_505820 [Umbelopsis sp. PMI_123]